MLKIVDSHVHFWEPGRLEYAWLREFPSLNRPRLPDHLSARSADWSVEALVFVQADCATEQGLAEVDWVTALAQDDRRIQAVVAFAPLERGEDVHRELADLRRRPLVRGVRRLIQSEPLGFSRLPGFVAGVQRLAEFGLSCDLCLRHFQMRDVIELVSQCPRVDFVLDHIGKPDIKHGRLDPWRTELAELARLPNVMCKLSGLVTEADWQRWTAADLRPFLEHALSVFGPDRVMFGSDWPVASLAATYPRWVETLMAATGSLPIGDREKLFWRNAARFYRLAELESEGQ